MLECRIGCGQDRVAHRVVVDGTLPLEGREPVLLEGPENNLVINVGCIHYKFDMEAEVVLHGASDDVGRRVILCVAQMGIFVDSRATGVPRHHLPYRIDWDKVMLAPRQVVVYHQRGRRASGWAWGGVHGGCLRASEAMLYMIDLFEIVDIQEYLLKESKDGTFGRMKETALICGLK